MTVPKVDMEELKERAEKNRKERLKFVEEYAEWVKRTDNKIWSRAQKKLID